MILDPGPKREMVYEFCHADNEIRVVFIDFGRAGGDDFDWLFSERLKDGRMSITKFRSFTYYFCILHVVLFMNNDPPAGKISTDRWDFIHADRTPAYE